MHLHGVWMMHKRGARLRAQLARGAQTRGALRQPLPLLRRGRRERHTQQHAHHEHRQVRRQHVLRAQGSL